MIDEKFLGSVHGFVTVCLNAATGEPLEMSKVYYDTYHLVSNMNEALDKIRRFTMKHPSYSLEQLMKEKRYVLLRGRENISQNARATLKKLSILNQDLYMGYLLKEQFSQLFQTKEENTAVLRLILWIKMSMKSKVKILSNIAKKV